MKVSTNHTSSSADTTDAGTGNRATNPNGLGSWVVTSVIGDRPQPGRQSDRNHTDTSRSTGKSSHVADRQQSGRERTDAEMRNVPSWDGWDTGQSKRDNASHACEQSQPVNINMYVSTYQPTPDDRPVRSRIVCGLLNVFLGAFGAGHFYVGRVGRGWLALLLCWTGIPEVVGFFRGLWQLLLMTDYDFARRYGVRTD